MKTQLLSIQPIDNNDSLRVEMSVGDERLSFIFSRSQELIGQTQITVINEDRDFAEVFQFNQHIAGEVMSLVCQAYKGERVQLPADVGDFGTLEEALALQKPRERENFTFAPSS
ncbi:hypothetical protein [Gloeocapsa sp. PCC 73106]|uniref:hypothetical protein n=1 Tax=Gloeocapsa sp. PCC 73106 TaxID=102232 RepID=UPI0002ABBFE6|nr:hypothetical protein [Gloeocapsa sp. PCC 73106]ELR96539.1 hypothetical protein GLO73106DRAFT_00003330 [Gloeocapsa sp. PCC 73106]